jgi:hypothetical protein
MSHSLSCRASRRLWLGALLAVLAASLALRAHRLDGQSLWYDEGNSARIAERSVQLIIEGAAGDIHPPLYYLLLHAWRAVFGETEFALRLLSAVCGSLLVAFTGLLGRELFGRRAGLIAAALAAVAPFAVYYSQEARMYVLLALEAAAATWALARLSSRGLTPPAERRPAGWRVPAAVYALATVAGLYTHYAYPFVMLAQGACFLAWLLAGSRRRARDLAFYAALNAGAVALFLPWLPTALHQVTGWTVSAASYELGPAVLDAARWIVVGRTLPIEQAGLPLAAFGLAALIGLWPAGGKPGSSRLISSRLAPAWMALMVVVPFALLFAFHLYRESYLKFLLVCLAPLGVLAGRGAAVVSSSWLRPSAGRGARLASAVLAAALTTGLALTVAPSLDNLFHNPAYARDDYRGIARLVQSGARPGDAVLFSAPNQWEVFTYYHRPGQLAPAIPLLYHPPDDAAVEAQLRPIVGQYQRLFVLYYGERESDPDGRIERWLARNAYKADEQWVGHIRLAVYGAGPTPPPRLEMGAAAFGDAIVLESAALDGAEVSVGGVVRLELDWRARQAPAARYKVFVHLGGPDAPPVAQNDAEPAAGIRPTDGWASGEAVVDRRAVWLKPGAPPGVYGVYLGLYDPATGQRLPVRGTDGQPAGDRLRLGELTVLP